jgi:hypothetical protein
MGKVDAGCFLRNFGTRGNWRKYVISSDVYAGIIQIFNICETNEKSVSILS